MPVLGFSRCRPNYLNNIFTWLGNELLQLRLEKVNVFGHSVRSTGRVKHMKLGILPHWLALEPGNTCSHQFLLRFYLLLLHQSQSFLLTRTLQKSFMASASPRLQSSESLWKGPSFGMYSTLTNLTAEKDPTSFPVRGFSLYYSIFP